MSFPKHYEAETASSEHAMINNFERGTTTGDSIFADKTASEPATAKESTGAVVLYVQPSKEPAAVEKPDDGSTNFFSLPRELRNQIYSEAMTFETVDSRSTLAQAGLHYSDGERALLAQKRHRVSFDPSLLCVSKQIHEEAKAEFYRDNMFTLLLQEDFTHVACSVGNSLLPWANSRKVSSNMTAELMHGKKDRRAGVAVTAALTFFSTEAQAELSFLSRLLANKNSPAGETGVFGVMISRYNLPMFIRDLAMCSIALKMLSRTPSGARFRPRLSMELQNTFKRDVVKIREELLGPWILLCPLDEQSEVFANELVPERLALNLESRLRVSDYAPLLHKLVERAEKSTRVVKDILGARAFNFARAYFKECEVQDFVGRQFHHLISINHSSEEVESLLAKLVRYVLAWSINTVLLTFLLDVRRQSRMVKHMYWTAQLNIRLMPRAHTASTHDWRIRRNLTVLDKMRANAVMMADQIRTGRERAIAPPDEVTLGTADEEEYEETLQLIRDLEDYAKVHGFYKLDDLSEWL